MITQESDKMKDENFTSFKLVSCKKDRCLNNGASMAPIMLYALCISTILCFFLLYSPTPFFRAAATKRDLLDSNDSIFAPPDQSVDRSCDLFTGQWIPNLNGSLYTNSSCLTIPDSKNCFKNGRNDADFLKWRWKPDACELPQFEPKTFLRIVRGKTMAFIGDSVARNQLESLLCLLSKEETPVNVYKDAEDRFRTWQFPRSEFTVKMLWTRFLVFEEESIINESNSGVFNLHIDKVDDGWAKRLSTVDFAVISDGHWFFRKLYLYERGEITGCVYCNEPNITDRGLNFAIRISFRTALGFIKECKKGMTTVVRTFSPAHFENGTWNGGGSCNRTSPEPKMKDEFGRNYLELGIDQLEEIKRAKENSVEEKRDMRIEAMDVTRAMLMRPDGHPGAYWGNKWMKGYNDCVHWCLPGPIDTWNDFLMAILEKQRGVSILSSLTRTRR